MEEKRDCTVVRSIPRIIAEALDTAKTIEQLVKDTYLNLPQDDDIYSRVRNLRTGLSKSQVNSRIYHKAMAPLGGSTEELDVSIRVVLIDHKLFLPCSPN